MTRPEKIAVLLNLFRAELAYADALSYSCTEVHRKFRAEANAIWFLYTDISLAGSSAIDANMVDGRIAVAKAAARASSLKIDACQLTTYDVEAVLQERGIVLEDDKRVAGTH